MLKLIMPHIHQQGMKQCITHIMRLSGEVKASVPSWSNMVWERQKMKLVWGFHSGQVGVWGEGLCTQVEAFIVWTSHQHQKRAHLGFLASLPRGGAGEGGARLKSCQHTWRNEVWLYHPRQFQRVVSSVFKMSVNAVKAIWHLLEKCHEGNSVSAREVRHRFSEERTLELSPEW